MYRVIIGKDVIKESKKILKPSQRKKLMEFLKPLKKIHFPNRLLMLNLSKVRKRKKRILIALELATTEYFTQFTGRKI